MQYPQYSAPQLYPQQISYQLQLPQYSMQQSYLTPIPVPQYQNQSPQCPPGCFTAEQPGSSGRLSRKSIILTKSRKSSISTKSRKSSH